MELCFEKKVENSFDETFDLNNDGVLDAKEIRLQFSYLERLGQELEASEDKDDIYADVY